METEEEQELTIVWVRNRFRFIEGIGEYSRLFLDVIKASFKKPPALRLFL